MSRTKIAVVVSLLFCANGFVNASEPQEKSKNERGFFSDDARGWHFYEDPKDDEDIEGEDATVHAQPPAATAQQPEQKEEIRLDIQWLRKNIPKLMDAAQNNPTKENISKYAYAQRLMLDMSSRFATRMSEYMATDTLLDEEKRRPTTTIGLSGFSKQIYDSKKQAMNLINEQAHLWYFYKSTCPYCKKQTPILNTLHELYGIEILSITMDNLRSAGMENFKHLADTNLIASTKMGVTRTPNIIMMKNDGSGDVNVTVGIETL
jgi:conjugal transfer pilus assembly protein TraF